MLKPAQWILSLMVLAAMGAIADSAVAQIKPVPTGPVSAAPPRLPIRVPGPECDEAMPMKGERPDIPTGATEVEAPVTVNSEDLGAVSTLYPGVDTTTDGFYPLPCDPSIGGTLPAGTEVEPTADEIAAETLLTTVENKASEKNLPSLAAVPTGLGPIPQFTMGPCLITRGGRPKQVPCDSPEFLVAGQPFEGRDIIFVHGLATGQLKQWLGNHAGAHKLWPQDSSEFINTNTYYRNYAMNYWKGHIRENLFDLDNMTNPVAGYQWPAGGSPAYQPKGNRILVIAWSSNQRLVYAQHAMLTQIYLAMTQGTNVITPPNYPKDFQKPFCANGCILISHSTGGEIISSTFGRIETNNVFGEGAAQISRQMRAHVAFEPALSGSRLATVAVAAGSGLSGTSTGIQSVLCPVAEWIFETTGACALDTSFVLNSVLVDLIPLVAQNGWGPAINSSPVPTVTVAGSHPSGNQFGVTKFTLPGQDDGVVTMNSACANPARVVTPVTSASGIRVQSYVRAFDMGIPTVRAIKMFLSYKNYRGVPPPGGRFIAGTCTPWLSATGMVMPVEDALTGTYWDTRQRYRNHYSFIMGTMDHAHDGGGDDSNPWPSLSGMSASAPRRYLHFLGTENAEEVSAVTDSGIYRRFSDGSYLVHPSFAGQVHEYRSGRYIKFRIFGKTRKLWIWRRVYHRLYNWENKASTHYVYEYVGRR